MAAERKIQNPKYKIQRGLSSEEARKRFKKFGQNALPEKPPPSDLSILISQIKNPLVYILMAAGVATLLLRQISDTSIILFAVILNTILSFFQERKASRALHELKKLIQPTAKVVRDGKKIEIDASNIVPGDLVILSQGDKIPADGKLIEANRLFVDEAILTGESVPVSKIAISRLPSVVSKKETDDRLPTTDDRIFMGTMVSSGRGRMIVELTGEETEMGKIAESVQEIYEDTPLKLQLRRFSKQLSYLVVFLVAFVFIVGLIRQTELGELFKTSVALAVSSIPEGILVGLTIVLAIGMRRILKKKGLVRHLISAETLGGVTTVCIDKTGTLTAGKMQVVAAVGNEADIARQMILANDHDDPIVIAAFEWARDKLKVQNSKLKTGEMLEKYDRIDSIPFSSECKFFASLHKWDTKDSVVFVNGAPEILLDWTDLETEEKEKIEKKIDTLTKEGKRIVGLAKKRVSISKKRLENKDVKTGLEWVGLLAFSDPVRPGVKEALEKTKLAGIKLIVITGDYPQTAVSVMQQLGIHSCSKCVMLGGQLKKIKTKVLSKRLAGEHPVKLFARTTPAQKLNIVNALKENGEVVAMMGDGVNDAPALNRADIGIVVGEASDVAKESADLVLLDSSFATIVSAIEEGRGIFDKVRKMILYLVSDCFEEIIAVVGTILLGLPLPVTAAQILWINLVSDGFPDMALTIDPKRQGIMQDPPRSPKESLVSPWMRRLILIVSGVGGLMALTLFVYFYKTTNNLILAQSIAFATLGINSLVYVFSIRTLKEPFWRQNPFDNMWLNISVIAGLMLQILPFTSSTLRNFFAVTRLSLWHWAIVVTSSLIMFIIIEVAKVTFKTKFFSTKKV
jgi:Ca2+-transporting ATPase